MKTSDAINNAIRILIKQGSAKNTRKWQAVNVTTNLVEISNVFFKMDMCSNIDQLAAETKADLPWSEDHFIERMSGSSNPGEQYKNWPYYKVDVDNSRFRPDNLFSHTYQERFWPEKKPGNRYNMGDWDDIKARLKDDPTTRQAFLAIWHPEDQSNNGVRVPCTIGYWFQVEGFKLNVTYLIRSCDARRHFRNDIYMTQRLAMEMNTFLDYGLSLGELNVWIGSFHCFESDIYSLKKSL